MTELAYRLALVHDALVYRGGAERVVATLIKYWPNVPLFTSAYLPNSTFDIFRQSQIHTSFVQKFARDPQTVMRRVFPLMVPGFCMFDFSEYDVVLSSAAYAAKAIRIPSSTCHLCYCYSPLRLAWRPSDYFGSHTDPLKRVVVLAFAAILRKWDYQVAQQVNFFATTCRNVAERIKVAYQRESEVIHAPIDFNQYWFQPKPNDYYLVVSRLNTYKRVDLAIQAMNQIGQPLLIVGEGPQRVKFERLAQSNIFFLGNVSDEKLLELYAGCKALIFPQEEDYGLVPLEAQASGRPVIAFSAGGALETIVDGQTGIFFREQTPDALINAIDQAEKMHFDPIYIRQHAAQFDEKVFCENITSFIKRKWYEFSEDI